MDDLWTQFGQYLTVDKVATAIRALLLLLAGFAIARLVGAALRRGLARHLDPQQMLLARRGAYYLIVGLFLLTALNQLGFNLGVLLGAAGILTVAIGFASQTAASNIVSGLFLIVERPFEIGDIIEMGGTTGEVISIDLLSVKLRTFDNLFVRIPNETVMKSEVKTLTKFPIRRVDMKVGVAYKESMRRVREILLEVADRNPLSLDEPKPLVIFLGFGDSSLDFQFSIWAKRENFLELRNGIQEEIKAAFDAEGIEIPFPHLTFYTGSATEALPIRLIKSD